jgi:transcriptional regulator with XRE-family HTH domain
MRLSPKSHPLAVLRLFLGLGQKEMADLLDCSQSTIQKIELRKREITLALAGRATQLTGVSGQWLLDGEPKRPIINAKHEKYSLKDFIANRIQTTQFSNPKESVVQEALEFHSQWRAMEVEEIMNRAIRKGRWPAVKLLMDDFCACARKTIGEAPGKMKFDAQSAARSFSERWAGHCKAIRDPRHLEKIQQDAVTIATGKKVLFSDAILAKIRKRHREFDDSYWEPVLDSLPRPKR